MAISETTSAQLGGLAFVICFTAVEVLLRSQPLLAIGGAGYCILWVAHKRNSFTQRFNRRTWLIAFLADAIVVILLFSGHALAMQLIIRFPLFYEGKLMLDDHAASTGMDRGQVHSGGEDQAE